ncbi:MAG: ABC-type metal ion transport system, surface component [Acidimicrobiales bacterium]|nr:ABC-type metal ion transport system, surface component [Acidimicrobiales bacterium]
MSRRPIALAVSVAAAVAALTGCGSGDSDAGRSGRLQVEASFYPLQWMAEQVGGRHVSVTNLTRPGAEPHDVELTPRQVAAIEDADVVVHLSGFQPAVDAAVADSGAAGFDARPSADLDLTSAATAGAGQDGDGDVARSAGGADPHFWLDPTRLAAVASAFTDHLADRDPGHAASYRANLRRLTAELDRLDGEYDAALADCSARDLVTSHEAFGYLARRYGMEQVGIVGLTPEREPSAADLAAVSDFVEEHDVRTIYFETLVDPSVATTVAAEAGARTAVLDPIEGLTEASEGGDYLEVMRANLDSLQSGQPCP